jgi:hypothetical protein
MTTSRIKRRWQAKRRVSGRRSAEPAPQPMPRTDASKREGKSLAVDRAVSTYEEMFGFAPASRIYEMDLVDVGDAAPVSWVIHILIRPNAPDVGSLKGIGEAGFPRCRRCGPATFHYLGAPTNCVRGAAIQLGPHVRPGKRRSTGGANCPNHAPGVINAQCFGFFRGERVGHGATVSALSGDGEGCRDHAKNQPKPLD